jgi:hypothetical protein
MPDLRSQLQLVLDHPSVRTALAALATGAPRVPGVEVEAISSLTPTAKSLVVAALAHELKRPVVVLTKDNETALAYGQNTSTFLGWLEPAAAGGVQVLPALDCSPYEGPGETIE